MVIVASSEVHKRLYCSEMQFPECKFRDAISELDTSMTNVS